MRRINLCLNTKLTEICQRTLQLETLNATLTHHLPPSLQTHCHVGSFNQNCLMIVVHDPVWASQLRYYLPELRDKLRKDAGLYQLASIKINVILPDITLPPTAQRKKNPSYLSHQAREAIMEGSLGCNDLPLKQALQKLANGLDRRSDHFQIHRIPGEGRDKAL